MYIALFENVSRCGAMVKAGVVGCKLQFTRRHRKDSEALCHGQKSLVCVELPS